MKASMPAIPYQLGAVVALFVSLAATPASATSALYLTELEHAERSTAVVVATIGEARVGVHPKWHRAITTTEVLIEEVLKGKAPEKLSIEQFGGTIDGRTLYVPGDARFERGERCVLFLRQVEGGWFLTAMQQSKYELRAQARGVLLHRTLPSGLFVRTPEGLEPFREPPRKPMQTLNGLRKRLHRAFAENGAGR